MVVTVPSHHGKAFLIQVSDNVKLEFAKQVDNTIKLSRFEPWLLQIIFRKQEGKEGHLETRGRSAHTAIPFKYSHTCVLHCVA